jgi:hypothetical protein
MQLDSTGSDFWINELVQYTAALWRKEPAIRKAYVLRSRLQVDDNTQ